MRILNRTYCLVIFFSLALLLASCSSSQRFSSLGRNSSSSSASFATKGSLNDDEPKQESRKKQTENLSKKQSDIISSSQTWIGVPYLWGGNTHKGVDCSGFVKNIYEGIGVSLPRTANQQYNFSKKISDDERCTGDLIFFSKGTKISHVGIYLGGNEIIHSASGRGVVRQSLSDSYLQKIYVGAGRVLDK